MNGLGPSVTVWVRELNEKIRERGSRSMRKDKAYALQLPCNRIYLPLSSYLAATRGYCRFF